MARRNPRRCYWFDDSGRERHRAGGKYGCLIGDKCHFAHPEDPEWASAPPSHPPPNHLLASDPDPPPLRVPPQPKQPPPPQPKPPPPPPPQTKRPSPPPAITPMPISIKMPNIGSFKEPTTPNASKPSPINPSAGKSSSSSITTLPSSSRMESYQDMEDTRDPHRRLIEDKSRSTREERSPPASIPSTSSRSLSTSGSQQKHGPHMEFIRLMANAIRARLEVGELETRYNQTRAMTKSSRYYDSSEETRAEFSLMLKKDEAHLNDKKKEFKDAVALFAKLETWPTGQPIDKTWRPEMLSSGDNELSNFVESLKQSVKKLSEQMNALSSQVASQAQPQIEAQDGNVRPTKKRRLSSGEKQLTEASSSSVTIAALGVAEFESIQETVEVLENRVTDLENSWNQYEQNMDEELSERLARALSMSQPVPVTEGGAVDEGLKADVQAIGKELEELAGIVAPFVTKQNQNDVETARLTEENIILKQQIVELQGQVAQQEIQHKQNEERYEALSSEVKALSAAMKASIVTKPASSPELPILLDTLLPPLLHSIREDVKTLTSLVRDEMKGMVDTKCRETTDMVSQRTDHMMRTVGTITNYIASYTNGGAPMPPTAM